MRIRGRRRCTDCETRWSYYETGSVACPDCGSVRSVGVEDERQLHTDAPASLDLTAARSGLDRRPMREVAREASVAAREYLRSRGFVSGDELLPLDETRRATTELRHAADVVRRALELDPDAEWYFVSLLEGADAGERPDEVPDAMRRPYGRAAADVVEAYRKDVAAWLDEHPHPEARSTLATLRDHQKRVHALDGDVPPAEADGLVAAARDLGAHLRDGDEAALASARDRLARLG